MGWNPTSWYKGLAAGMQLVGLVSTYTKPQNVMDDVVLAEKVAEIAAQFEGAQFSQVLSQIEGMTNVLAQTTVDDLAVGDEAVSAPLDCQDYGHPVEITVHVKRLA